MNASRRPVHACLALLAATSLAWAARAEEAAWSLRVPEAANVSFRGLANFDQTGVAGGSILYPVPGAAGLIAAVITHGVVVGALHKGQRDKAQEMADEVLKPFEPVIQAYRPEELLRRGAAMMSTAGTKRLLRNGEAAESSWVVHSEPQFAMTQDRRALVMDNLVAVYRAADPATPAYTNTIRVVSSPVAPEDDPAAPWMDKDGAPLKDTAAALWAESIDIALANMRVAAPTGPERTVRYLEGGAERFERAQVLSERCDRLLVRTLRGELMSVPPRNVPASCAGTPIR